MKCMQVIFAVICLAGSVRATLDAQEVAAVPAAKAEKVTGSASLGVMTDYIFRGYRLNHESLVIQPSATLGYKNFSLTFWDNIDTDQKTSWTDSDHSGAFNPPPPAGQKRLNEADISISYTRSAGKLGLTGGFVYYGTSAMPETEELFFIASYDVLLKPKLSVYQDIDRYCATYLNLSMAHSLTVAENITFDMSASAGYLIGLGDSWKTYIIGDDAAGLGNSGKKYSAWHDGMLQAGFSIPAGGLSFQPLLQYWFPLSADAGRTVQDGAIKHANNPSGIVKSTFVAGITATLSF